MKKNKLLAALLILLPASAFAMTADIDCYYPNHEEHLKNIDIWRPATGNTLILINWNSTNRFYLSTSNCIIREK